MLVFVGLGQLETWGQSVSVRYTIAGRVRPGDFPGQSGNNVTVNLNSSVAQLTADCVNNILNASYCDPDSPTYDPGVNCCVGSCSIPPSQSQVTTLTCGTPYTMTVQGKTCGSGVNINFSQLAGITASSSGYIVEIKDNATQVVQDTLNIPNFIVPTGQTKSWTITVKPKQVIFSQDSITADGKGFVQAKLSFANGTGHFFTGTPQWSLVTASGVLGCTIDPVTGWIRGGYEQGEITVVATDSASASRKAMGVLRIGCSACDGDCGVGQGYVANKTDALSVPLGSTSCARGWIGSVRLKLTSPAAALTTPAGLVFDNITPEVIRDVGLSGINQVKAPQAFVNVVVTVPEAGANSEFEIRVYWPENSGPKSGSLYVPPTSPGPIKVWRVTRLAADFSSFRITEDPAGVNIANTFTWSAADNGWTLDRNSVVQERKMVQAVTPVGAETTRRTETVDTKSPGSANVDSKTMKTISTLNLNSGAVQRPDVLVEDRSFGNNADGTPANSDQVTTYYYAATTTADGHEKQQRVVRSDGSWEHYEYTGDQVTAIYSPWLDSAPPINSDQSPSVGAFQKTVFSYTPLAGDTSTDTQTPRKKEVYVQEAAGPLRLVSRSYVILSVDASVTPALDVRRDIQARTATDINNTDPNNPVTIRRTFAGGPFKGMLHSVDNPDGTRTAFTYTHITTEVREGTAGVASDAITDGRRTVTTRTTRGLMEKLEVFDILNPTKQLLNDVWSVPGASDPLGRFTLLTHLDGTTETFAYDCCSLIQTKDRERAITVFTPDALKRIWKTSKYFSPTPVIGIELRQTFDAVGNVKKTTRFGTDGNSMDVLPLRDFDRSGRVVREQTPLAIGYITTVEGTTGSGGRLVITTYPDTGTRTEEYYRDGRLAKIRGTAARPAQFEYGIDPVTFEQFTKETKLDATGLPTTEWTKIYFDFLGREYKTVFADSTPSEADNAYTQRYYKDNSQLWKERDADGVFTVYIYNARGQVEYTMTGQKVEPSTPPTVPDTSGEHRLSRSESFVSSYTDGTTYDTILNRVTEWTTLNAAANAVVSERHVSLNGLRQWNITAPNQITKSVTQYGASTKIITTTQPDSSYQIQSFSYGRPTMVQDYSFGGSSVGSTTYQYDTHGRLWKTTDARNGTTTFSFNNADQVTTVSSTLNGTPQTQTTLYDSMGRPTQSTEPDGMSVYTRYYKSGLVKLSWGARTLPSGYEYDAQGRVTRLYTWQSFVAPDPAIAEPAFPVGGVSTVWNYDPYRGWLQFKRDANNVGPDYTYSANGRVKTRASARNVAGSGSRLTATFTYDFDAGGLNPNRKVGYLAKIDYNDGAVPSGEISTPGLAFDYDRRGRPRTITQGSGGNTITTTPTWHDSGAVEREAYSGSFLNTLSADYDNVFASGIHRRESMELRKAGVAIGGTAVTYGYDTAGRIQTVTSAGLPASPTFSATYSYVPNSTLLESTTLKHGTTTRLTIANQFDLFNRWTSVAPTPSVASQPPLSRTYSYNQANQRILRMDGDLSVWRYDYDNKGEIISAKHAWADGQYVPGQQYEFGHDDVGNRLFAREGGDAVGTGLRQTGYMPNNLNQYSTRSISAADRKVDIMGLALVSGGAPTAVTINGSGPDYRRGEYFWKTILGAGAGPNWQSVNIVAGISSASGNVYVPPQTETFTYDTEGNLTSDARWVYKWDAENRLSRIDTQVAAAAVGVPTKRVVFFYDYQHRLIRKQVFSGTYNAGAITWSGTPDATAGADLIYLYDGLRCIATLKPDQTLYQSYVWGLDISSTPAGAGGVGGLLMFRRVVGGNTETYFPAFDGGGNVTALIKGEDAGVAGSAGTVAARYEYGPFGNLLRISGDAVGLDNPFRFSTKLHDDYSDLLYYGYRFYNPSTGRWLNRDPIGEAGGFNLNAFGNNDLVNGCDPLGLVLAAFDGTNNDRDRDAWGGKKNSPSNIEIMSTLYRGEVLYKWGVGTRTDILLGNLAGRGLGERIDGMLEDLKVYVNEHPQDKVDIIGFSRGAASARIFSNRVRKEIPCAKIRFLGLYDTVSQVGLPNRANYQFGYDLDVDTTSIGSTAHAVARDEHRSLFPLTSLSQYYAPHLPGFPRKFGPSQIVETKGPGFWEKPFAGVHSDIGGGYQDTRNLSALNWMIKRGQAAGAPFANLNRENYPYFDKLVDLKGPRDHDSRYPFLDRVPFTHWGRSKRTVFPGDN